MFENILFYYVGSVWKNMSSKYTFFIEWLKFYFYYSTRFNRTLRKQLGQCLNPPNSKSNDWRMLAQRLNVDRWVFHCIRILSFNKSSVNSSPFTIFKSNHISVVKSSKFVPNKCHTLMSFDFLGTGNSSGMEETLLYKL